MIGEKAVGIGMKGEIRVGESLRIGMLSSPSTSGKTYEDPCPIQTRRDKRIESESFSHACSGLVFYGLHQRLIAG